MCGSYKLQTFTMVSKSLRQNKTEVNTNKLQLFSKILTALSEDAGCEGFHKDNSSARLVPD